MSALYQLVLLVVSIFKLSVNEKSYNHVKSFLRGPFGNMTPIFPHECVFGVLFISCLETGENFCSQGPHFFSPPHKTCFTIKYLNVYSMLNIPSHVLGFLKDYSDLQKVDLSV